MQFKLLALAGLASLTIAQETPSLVQALNSTSDLANLTTIIQSQPGLAEQLAGLTNITILAPNNDAVTQFLGALNESGVTPDAQTIQSLLQYHVLNGTYQEFSEEAQFVPTALMSQGLTSPQVVEVRNTTVFSGLRANSSILDQSVNFTGGVIHVIDRVLTVPLPISNTSSAFGLSSFNGALNATQLTDTVNNLQNVTIFIPDNEAFQNIGSALPNLTTEEIVGILNYHVIAGTVAYSSLLSNESVASAQGNNLTITVVNATTVFVNSARVVVPDVLVANGVVHIIDEVLNPNNTAAPSEGASEGAPAFSGASSATEAPFTSGQPPASTTVNTAEIASSATGGAGSSSSSGGAYVPKPTGGAAGAAAVLGGLALLMQL